MKHWIFGYGSLICADSRARTGVTGEALPVVLQGFERSWSVPIASADLSVVGIQRQADQRTGGVIFPLSDSELKHFDAREVEYERVPLARDHLQLLREQPMPDGDFWVYLPQPSTSEHPIAQSYLDVILHGCIQESMDFARHFLQHTSGWKLRLNDREAPLYPRPLNPKQQVVLPLIDHLLEEAGPLITPN
ncbi:MAG: gamma-glutamylcyclotransferase [Natronospirillum sp.]